MTLRSRWDIGESSPGKVRFSFSKLQQQHPHPWRKQIFCIFENRRNLSFQVRRSRTNRDPMLEKEAAELVDHCCLPAHPAIPDAVQRLHIELSLVLHRHETHRRPLHRLGNGSAST